MRGVEIVLKNLTASLLSHMKQNLEEKEKWVNQVKGMGHYSNAKFLLRFMLNHFLKDSAACLINICLPFTFF